MFQEIEDSVHWQSVEKISKGWSDDEKYKIRKKSDEILLLRIASKDQYEKKKKEYEMITKYSKTGIHMSMPVEFGICNGGQNVYMLLSWVEGQDLEKVLPNLSEKEQYQLGRMAGSILRKIHEIRVD